MTNLLFLALLSGLAAVMFLASGEPLAGAIFAGAGVVMLILEGKLG